MTPHNFLTKWRHVELKERSASQSHFNDLCALLGVLDPVSADPHRRMVYLRKGREQDQRRRRLGRCLAQGVLRLGV
jgi:hypothetical protein